MGLCKIGWFARECRDQRELGDKYRNLAGSNVSLMPLGLINALEKEEILDLLAYLQSGGIKGK